MISFENMRTHNIWSPGWLKDKQYCYNDLHPKFNPLIDRIVRDLNKGMNRIIIIVGTPRSGKSWFSFWLQCFLNYNYFGRKEYKPGPDNMNPLKDFFWEVDDFIEATTNPANRNKFITQEEQGVEQYSKDWQNQDVQDYDKLTQIFGIDNTNIIINLPYIFDLNKGTRLKGHYLLRSIRKSKKRVNIVMCRRWMNITTEKAKFVPDFTWENIPDVSKLFANAVKEYENKKLEYNRRKKQEFLERRNKKLALARGSGKVWGKID